MCNPKEVTREDVLRVADTFRWTKKMPKWTVIVCGHELPARPLVLRAAGVAPNDPTNSHQAVAILEGLGFETRYSDASQRSEMRAIKESSDTPDMLGSIVEAISDIAGHVPKAERDSLPRDLSKNVDHYLYGNEKEE